MRGLLETQAGLIAFLVGTDGAPTRRCSPAEHARAEPWSASRATSRFSSVSPGSSIPKKEDERIERGVKKLDKDIAVLEKRLASENFVKNAPPEVVAEARAQLEQLKRQRERLLEAKALVDELEKS